MHVSCILKVLKQTLSVVECNTPQQFNNLLKQKKTQKIPILHINLCHYAVIIMSVNIQCLKIISFAEHY